jgi:predicted kinase
MPKRFLPGSCLILLMGVAGSGKTTLANGILRRLWAVYLDNNQIAGVFFPHTRRGVKYTALRPYFYKALYRIAEENLKLGNSVLLDVPHMKEAQEPKWRRNIEDLVSRAGAKLIAIRCRCAENVLRSRLESRDEKRDRWKLGHWNEFLREQPIEMPLPFPHLDIDTEKNLLKNTATAMRYILEHGAKRKAHGAKSKERSAEGQSA